MLTGMLSSSIIPKSLHTQPKFSCPLINRNSVIPALKKETTGTTCAYKKHTCHKCPLLPSCIFFFFFLNECLNRKFGFRWKSNVFMPRSMCSFHHSYWVQNTDAPEVTQQKSLPQKTRIFDIKTFLIFIFLTVENANKCFNSILIWQNVLFLLGYPKKKFSSIPNF